MKADLNAKKGGKGHCLLLRELENKSERQLSDGYSDWVGHIGSKVI